MSYPRTLTNVARASTLVLPHHHAHVAPDASSGQPSTATKLSSVSGVSFSRSCFITGKQRAISPGDSAIFT